MGILPLTILMVVLGDQLHRLPWQVWVAVFSAGLILWLVMRRMFGRQRERRRHA